MNKEHILFVDDERFFARNYARELEHGYRVTLVCTAVEGVELIRNSTDLRAVILDVQMPTPSSVQEYETRGGIDTGIWVMRSCRKELLEKSLPILLLTNRNEDDLKKLVREMRFPETQVEIFHKMDVSYREFASKCIATSIRRHAAYLRGSDR